jgi:hypothetical protein
MGKYYYGIMWLAIGVISSIDLYWSIVYQSQLYEIELNPLGRFLIAMDNGQVSLFMAVKMLGTIAVLGALVVLYHWRRSTAWPVMTSIFVFQSLLLVYIGQCVAN